MSEKRSERFPFMIDFINKKQTSMFVSESVMSSMTSPLTSETGYC